MSPPTNPTFEPEFVKRAREIRERRAAREENLALLTIVSRDLIFKRLYGRDGDIPVSKRPITARSKDIAEELKALEAMVGRTTNLDNELKELGQEIADTYEATAIFGPVKKPEDAKIKVNRDYKGDWYELKDYVRMTIVPNNLEDIKKVQALIRTRCVASRGLGIIKDSETFADKDPCGYSGLNFVINMSRGGYAEIQVNIAELMYGKMSPEDFQKVFINVNGLFTRIESEYYVEPGLGHGLYEIYRKNPEGVKEKRVADISKNYYNYLRGRPRQFCSALNSQLNAIKKENPEVFENSVVKLFNELPGPELWDHSNGT